MNEAQFDALAAEVAARKKDPYAAVNEILARAGIGAQALKLGDLEFHIIEAGRFALDGGAMFGVIPKPMWEKKAPPDAPQSHRAGDEFAADSTPAASAFCRNRRRRQTTTTNFATSMRSKARTLH